MDTVKQSTGSTISNRTMTEAARYPARILFELERTTRYNDRRPALELRDRDLLSCPEGLTTYTAGTVVSYALKSGDDPIKAVQLAEARGHQLAWLNQNASVLSSRGRGEPEHCIIIRPGDLIRMEGRTYRVKRGNNPGNLNLIRDEVIERDQGVAA